MEFVLRPASAADYRWLWELKRDTMRTYVEQTWGSWEDAAQEAFFRRSYSPDKIQIILLNGERAGLLHLEREPDAIFLANIQIHIDHQGRGLGTAVIRSLLQTAQTLRTPIRLQVLRVNAGAQRLYLRLGFVVSGETATHQMMRWLPK